EAFGPLPAFLFGWTELAVIRASSLGAISTVFAEYLGHFVPLTPLQIRYVAAVVLLIVGAINYIGVRRAAAVKRVTTIAKYAAVMALGVLAFTATGGSAAHFTPAWPGGLHLSLVATALISVM